MRRCLSACVHACVPLARARVYVCVSVCGRACEYVLVCGIFCSFVAGGGFFGGWERKGRYGCVVGVGVLVY